MSISVVLIVKNAQDTIVPVLKSVSFAQEIIVVDIQSSDDTRKLAQKYTKHVFDFGQDSRFVEPVRNFALNKASQNWVLVLDGDEEVSPELAKKLLAIASDPDSVDAYYLPRKNLFSGYFMRHTGWWPDYQLRFFRRGRVSWSKQIHARPLLAAGTKTQKLPAEEGLALIHHNYNSTSDYLSRFARYTDIEAEQKLTVEPKAQFSSSGLLKDFADDFLRRLFAEQGYRDGVRGFYLSVMQAAYQMTVKMKMFDLMGNSAAADQSNPKQLLLDLRSFQKELNYWINEAQLQGATGIRKWWFRLKRKINL